MAGATRPGWTDTGSTDKDHAARLTARTLGTRLTERALAPGTRDVYRRVRARFEEWRADRPMNDATLADYLGALFDRGIAPTTATVVVSAVLAHGGRGDESGVGGSQTGRALCAFRRDGVGRGRGQVTGISWEQADRMADLAQQGAKRVADVRDALLVRIVSDCMLRVAEASALDVADIAFEDDWLRVVVRRGKTDQEGTGTVLYAGPPTARLARRWLASAGLAQGPLFRPVNKGARVGTTRLSPRSMRDIVKRRAADAGIMGRISGHSLRVGAAQSLRDAGATVPELLAAGRWKRVETMARYTSTQEAAAGPVARLRYGVEPRSGRITPAPPRGASRSSRRTTAETESA